ncbi:hypothetical protein WN982_10880 [Paraburkholderia sp. IMGN_8]|uniref:hypothetical protein n=1 Tax=Paraburkholderia sp. IMGN_8 TaxID=3136564 RepID=UPI0031017170
MKRGPIRIFLSALCLVMAAALLPAHAQVRTLDRALAANQATGAADTSTVQQSVRTGNPLPGHSPRNRPSVVGNGAGLPLPHWSSSFRTGGIDYPFTVIGADPASGQTSVIPTIILPYRFVFSDGTILDATTDVVDGITPLNGVLGSPAFQRYPFQAGPTPLGTTQWGDAFMRANFWSVHSDQGPGYHVLLATPTVLAPVTIPVPADIGYTFVVGGQRYGVVDFWWLTDVQTTVMRTLGVSPDVLTIHLASTVIYSTQEGGNFLGYHSATDLSATTHVPGINTYIQTSYFPAAAFGGRFGNVTVLAHEVVEWLNDPLLNNAPPVWRDPVVAHYCWNYLMEVADPLERLVGFQVTLNGRSYLLPDAVFQPWFSRMPVSFSANGWYSFANRLSSYSEKCPVFEIYATAALRFLDVDTTVFTGINNSKQVVGYVTFGTALGSFRLDNVDPVNGWPVTVTSIYVPGSRLTLANKINDQGQVVGIQVDSGGAMHGFLLSNGQYSSVDFPGAIATEALAINNAPVPVIVGNFTDATGVTHGFVLRNGVYRQIDYPFATDVSITGINDSEQIVGLYDDAPAPGVHGFVGNLGTATALEFPPLPRGSTSAGGINNAGNVIGTVRTTGGAPIGFLFGAGNYEDVALGTGFPTLMNDINNADLAVGNFYDRTTGSWGAIAVPLSLTPGRSEPPAPMLLRMPAGMFGR